MSVKRTKAEVAKCRWYFRFVPEPENRQSSSSAPPQTNAVLFGILTPLHAGFIRFDARGDFLCHLLQLSLFGRACGSVSAADAVQLLGFRLAVFSLSPIQRLIPISAFGDYRQVRSSNLPVTDRVLGRFFREN
jgi:hypothetical protein